MAGWERPRIKVFSYALIPGIYSVAPRVVACEAHSAMESTNGSMKGLFVNLSLCCKLSLYIEIDCLEDISDYTAQRHMNNYYKSTVKKIPTLSYCRA